MHASRTASTRIASLILAAFLGAFAALPADAAEVTFRIGAQDNARSATIQSFTQDGVAYVPLGDVVRQLGGSFSVAAAKAQIEFEDKAAIIAVNDKVVSGTLSQFTLSNNLIERGGEAYIALDDVVPFFTQAFQVTPEQEEPLGAAPPAAPVPAETVDPVVPAPPPASPGAAMPGAQVVIIDPGHGGNDSGIQGQSLSERDLTLALAQRLQNKLQAVGLPSVLTRSGDEAIPLVSRINTAIQSRGALLVSLHAGASFAGTASGFEIFYPTDTGLGDIAASSPASTVNSAERFRFARQSRDVAEAIGRALANGTGAPLKGIHTVRSPLLHNVPMPGVLLEAGVLTNPTEEAALKDPAYQDRIAQALADGIRQYLGAGIASAAAAIPRAGAAP